ncbi:MAG TPA: hypothetical protein VEA61_02750 [Allosphingosinicella sp.]|nr:hypothetical protein [Allosphingosinicella sp.]
MTGAERAQTQPEPGLTAAAQDDWLGPPVELHAPEEAAPQTSPRPVDGGVRLFGALLLVLAAAWVGAVGYHWWQTRPPANLATIISWAATLAGPLALLALLWLLGGRSSRREAERFSRAVEAMTAESRALESVLEIVASRIEANHSRLRGEAERLMSLGDEASDRLGRVTYYLSKETASLDQKAAALDAAAAAAKVDIGVLLHDLPRAEAQARAVAEAMKEAGLAAHGQASALEAQLASLAARGRDADEALGGAAQRLSAHVARIESGSAAAAASLDESSAKMNAAVDGAMSRAADAVEAARAALELQGSTTLAAIEQSRAALDKAGEDAARHLTQRLETISGKIEALAGHISAQDAASHALVTGLAKELAELDAWFERLGRTGAAQGEQLGEAVAAVRTATAALIEELGAGQHQTGELIDRAGTLGTALTGLKGDLREALPAALQAVEVQADRTREAAAAIAPIVGELEKSAVAAAARLGESETAVVRQREAIETLLARLGEGASSGEAQLRALGAAAEEAQAAAQKMVADTGPELIEALLRVREAAAQASERAREAIFAAIPASADSLAEASREALERAVSETVERQMAELSGVSERAIETARRASERLTRQMLSLGETAAAIEARIDEERRQRETKESENFSRRVALLIESLNSTAIDVTKILSNEVTDSAWAAYLKGDRGVFTRRAVRLLDNNDAREIARHYEEEPEFREQVNRYIHDFEAMLRRILADRDGSPLGVTILSSDMGKLYVALAQAIERIR